MAHDEAMHRYEEEYDALKAKLQAVGFIGQGSVQTRRIACGSPTCRCHHDPDARHGPYHYWTRKARGKTVGLKLTEDELGLYREWIAKAIADRQSEIERLQAEIKALNDVDKMLGSSAPLRRSPRLGAPPRGGRRLRPPRSRRPRPTPSRRGSADR